MTQTIIGILGIGIAVTAIYFVVAAAQDLWPFAGSGDSALQLVEVKFIEPKIHKYPNYPFSSSEGYLKLDVKLRNTGEGELYLASILVDGVC